MIPNLKQLMFPAAVLGAALVIAASIVSMTLYSIRGLDNTLATTGSAKKSVRADSAVWRVMVTKNVFEGGIPSGYAAVERDMGVVREYLLKEGIASGDIAAEPIFVDQDYTPDPNAPRRYVVRGLLAVSSKDPEKIESLSRDLGSLIARGIMLTPQVPEYFISTLPELRVELLGEALADAKRRAQEIAQGAGDSVGKLKSASSGVVQVLRPNSIDIADYGAYDTSSIDKEVMVTVRAVFFIR